MRVSAKIASCAAAMGVVLMLAPAQRTEADLLIASIRAADDCPQGVTIQSKAGEGGMIVFDAAVDAEAVANAGDLYKGRVRSSALLKLASADGPIAQVAVEGWAEKEKTHYSFLVSPSAAKTSELQVATSLYEKDGQPTLGGGVCLQIQLAGFVPKTD